MSLFSPVQRATLLIPSGETNHLFIILTNPAQFNEYVTPHSLLVGIGSIYPDRPYDPTCCLFPGDHPFIRHNSYINYHYARIQETRKLVDGCNTGLFEQRDAIDGGIFARICQGLMESRHTILKVRQFYEQTTVCP